jgi:hypothetical protein
MRFVLPVLLGFAPAAFAANPVNFTGTCTDGVTPFDITFDLDELTVSSSNTEFSTFDLDVPVVTEFCGSEETFTVAQVSNDTSSNCSGLPSADFIVFFGSAAVYLEDSTATVFDSTDAPTSIDLADFDFGFGNPDSSCGTGGGITGVTPGVLDDMTLLERATEARDFGATAYDDLFMSPPRLTTPEAMESFLFTPAMLLQNAGCEIDRHFGGAYGAIAVGEDDEGEMTDLDLTRATKEWEATFSDSLVVTGGYNRQAQLLASRDDGGFAVGRFVRTRGIQGTFYGISGSCDAPLDYEAVLGSWFRGALPSL